MSSLSLYLKEKVPKSTITWLITTLTKTPVGYYLPLLICRSCRGYQIADPGGEVAKTLCRNLLMLITAVINAPEKANAAFERALNGQRFYSCKAGK